MLLNWSSFGSRLSARTDWSIWGQEAGKPQLLSAVPSISGWPRGSKAPDSVQSLLNRVEKHLQPGSNLPHSYKASGGEIHCWDNQSWLGTCPEPCRSSLDVDADSRPNMKHRIWFCAFRNQEGRQYEGRRMYYQPRICPRVGGTEHMLMKPWLTRSFE